VSRGGGSITGKALTDYRREGPKAEVYYVLGQDLMRTITGSFLDVRKARKARRGVEAHEVHGQEIGWYGDAAAPRSPKLIVTGHGVPRTRDTLADRLRRHPGVEQVCENRAGAYTEAARRGAERGAGRRSMASVAQNSSRAVETPSSPNAPRPNRTRNARPNRSRTSLRPDRIRVWPSNAVPLGGCWSRPAMLFRRATTHRRSISAIARELEGTKDRAPLRSPRASTRPYP
jgi:hypothetical protein